MDNYEYVEQASLENVLQSFIGSYTERDKSMEFSSWLGYKLRQDIPELSQEASEKLADEIIKAVAVYDRTLEELKKTVEEGQSKEGWFADRLTESYTDMTPADVGNKLLQIEENLTISNSQLMQNICGLQPEIDSVNEEERTEEAFLQWNEYSVRNKAREVGKQVALTGVAVVASIMKERVQNKDNADISSVVKETLQDGLIEDPKEVKAVVAGAVKVAVKKGVRDIIPEDVADDIATDMIGSIAGVAVEGTSAMLDLASGESTMTDAVDRIGVAAVAAGGHLVSNLFKGCLASIPYVGSLLVDLSGGLLDHLKGYKFANNIYTTVRDAAIESWEGIKKSKTVSILRKLPVYFK